MPSAAYAAAMSAALAKIDAAGHAAAARRNRIETDPRVVFLGRIVAACRTEITGHGMNGGMQMMIGVLSAKETRRGRAGCLLRARHHQIAGRRVAAATELRAAKHLRRAEVERLTVEGSLANLAAVDAALVEAAKPLVRAA